MQLGVLVIVVLLVGEEYLQAHDVSSLGAVGLRLLPGDTRLDFRMTGHDDNEGYMEDSDLKRTHLWNRNILKKPSSCSFPGLGL